MSHSDHAPATADHPGSFEIRILRQDEPGAPSYWERHRLEWEPDMNITSCLQRIAANAETTEGEHVAPVCYESNCLEEICGSCTMLINGRTRQACSALVNNLLKDNPGEIELRPMSKFPVIRDLLVDRSRLFRALEKVKAWIPVDGYYDLGPGPRQSQSEQLLAYPLSQCMSCGCCLEACPQYTKIELARQEGETDEQFSERKRAAYDQGFVGAHAISQTILFNTHPTGRMNGNDRTDALMEEGGLQICGNAQNCVAVCPKNIPLTTSIGLAGRAATKRAITKFFDR
jgi:succinate dehydrogenase / fumarate reductase, iron-sulfur subunit